MTTPLPLPLLGCLLGLTVVGSYGIDAKAADAPPEITTDSPAYCLQLHDRVETLRLEAAVQPTQEIANLSAEGLRMCGNGLTRGGVMRLRRALAILMHPDEDH